MKKNYLVIVCVFFQFILTTAKAELKSLEYPPQEWGLSIRINVSHDILISFLDFEPYENVGFSHGSITLYLRDYKNGISGPLSHPILTGKLTREFTTDHDSSCIGIVPKVDHLAIYKSAFRVIEAFDFADTFPHSRFDAPGVDISMCLEVNGRSIEIEYSKLQATEGLPDELRSLFALFRRNLPELYGKLFDYFDVPELPPLIGDEANNYKRCDLHEEWMKVAEIPIEYGWKSCDRVEFHPTYHEARKKLFQNANTSTSGGCSGGPKTEKSLYCESCRKSELEWRLSIEMEANQSVFKIP